MSIRRFEELEAWQVADELKREVYALRPSTHNELASWAKDRCKYPKDLSVT